MKKKIVALKVNQWLKEWERFEFESKQRRRKPEPYFYVFKLSAPRLKVLSGIFRRTAASKEKGYIENIQRIHEEYRSEEIKRFIRYGYPYSDISLSKLSSGKYEKLKKPGWLPTAIIINILTKGDTRLGNNKVNEKDLINIEQMEGEFVNVVLPESFDGNLKWEPKGLHPIEVIDGQHRLWAFEGDKDVEDFELPVVAFHGLDISWQAYLFWSINITPKKINASLAYDLYPLLRSEDWLDTEDNYIVYRETRAQEIVEALWSNTISPWYKRINMLGEKGTDAISQSSFLRSLVSTFLRGKQKKLGGLFSVELNYYGDTLPWNGAQQVAYLIFIWDSLIEAINNSKDNWANSLRNFEGASKNNKGYNDPAFSSKYSLLKTDQGVRAILYVYNDLSLSLAEKIKLEKVFESGETSARATDEGQVKTYLKILKANTTLNDFLNNISTSLLSFDWRTSAFPTLTNREQSVKAGYRGSGGYKMLRYHLLEQIGKRSDEMGQIANTIRKAI
ncbi:MAG: DGQHR domain-containing protein [Melioribacteraceae bacterium]|nr:DGQHR domain-containing protein [Melioribacteraceae bacterium]